MLFSSFLLAILGAFLLHNPATPSLPAHEAGNPSVPRPVPTIEEPAPPDHTNWLYLGQIPIRFYGPRFQEGLPTASAIPYRPDARIASIGRQALARLRQLSSGSASVRHVCIARDGPCRAWGFQLRIVDPKAGRQLEVSVEDTGAGDGIDLPDTTWRLFGYPPSQGVFWGDVWVRLK